MPSIGVVGGGGGGGAVSLNIIESHIDMTKLLAQNIVLQIIGNFGGSYKISSVIFVFEREQNSPLNGIFIKIKVPGIIIFEFPSRKLTQQCLYSQAQCHRYDIHL